MNPDVLNSTECKMRVGIYISDSFRTHSVIKNKIHLEQCAEVYAEGNVVFVPRNDAATLRFVVKSADKVVYFQYDPKNYKNWDAILILTVDGVRLVSDVSDVIDLSIWVHDF